VSVEDSQSAGPGRRRAASATRRLAAIPLFVFVLGVLCTAGVALQLYRVADNRDRERFAHGVDRRLGEIQDRLET
jgi:hypothetical protein